MSSPKPWLTYSLLRVGLFVVVFAVLALTGVNPILAAVIAAIVGLCVSYIFFRSQRDQVATSLAEWRSTARRDRDGDAEDAALDETDQVRETRQRSEGERGGKP